MCSTQPKPWASAPIGSGEMPLGAGPCATLVYNGLVKLAQLVQIPFILAAAFFVYAFVATAKDGETRRACTSLCALRPNYAAQERRAPDFELPTMNGGTRRLSDYRGDVVILNFWTKTCTPCLEEMPSLARLGHALAKRKGVHLLTVTTDESAEDARSTLRSLFGSDPPFEVLIDPEARVVTDRFGTKLFPETWFIDPKGVIRARVDGPRDWSNPLVLEFASTLRYPVACDIEFSGGKARGTLAGLCDEVAAGF